MSQEVVPRARAPRFLRARRARARQREAGVTLTFEGRVLVAFLSAFTLAALLLGEELILLLGCLGLGAVATVRLLVGRALPHLEVERVLPRRSRVGLSTSVSYELYHGGRHAAVGTVVEDPLGGPVRPRSLSLLLGPIPAGQRIRHREPVAFLRRGIHRIDALRLSTLYPLGLFRAYRTVGAAQTLLVRPREGRPTPALRDRLTGSAQAEHRPSLRLRGNDAFHAIREFRDGDDPRRIHWRTTARRGSLTVAEWHRDEGREVLVLLGRSSPGTVDSLVHFERAVSAAATVLRLAVRHGLRARLALGRPGERAKSTRRPGISADLDALATVKAQGGRRPRAALRLAGRRPGSRVVVYVATGPEPGIGRRLEDAAGPAGDPFLLRADQPDLARWVRGLA